LANQISYPQELYGELEKSPEKSDGGNRMAETIAVLYKTLHDVKVSASPEVPSSNTTLKDHHRQIDPLAA